MSIPSTETTRFDSPMEADSSPPPLPPPVPPQAEPEPEQPVYRTKVIQFFGKKTRIILQNGNGPCPLIAICNILSLKNRLILPDDPEVDQQTLLTHVADEILGLNTKNDDVDPGIKKNKEQNITDAMDTLLRLTTGIDVNVQFGRIDGFEFTSESAIFDLLRIPLYHGWIVDPQDEETAKAIGSKSYNTLMGELVSLESQTLESDMSKIKEDIEENTVDFVAATTAALGVPSPCLSRGQSFDESLCRERKGDIEEEAELLRALKLSADNRTPASEECIFADVKSQESVCVESPVLPKHSETVNLDATDNKTYVCEGPVVLVDKLVDKNSPDVVSTEDVWPSSKEHQKIKCDQPTSGEATEVQSVAQKTDFGAQVERKNVQSPCFEEPVSSSDDILSMSRIDTCAQNESNSTSELGKLGDLQNDCKMSETNIVDTAASCSMSEIHKIEEPKASTANVDSGEPIYEGEERILDSGTLVDYENGEPVYEGEVILAEQRDQDRTVQYRVSSGMSIKQAELAKNFIENNPTQLSIHGLFCLQEEVKERALSVLFRNNHFNTMFKFQGTLYILVTDQGYQNEPDFVWEKLTEVNGDTAFVNGDFQDSNSNGTWDEQDVLVNNVDYLANFKTGAQENSSFTSDHQMALELQQKEYEQSQQQQQRSLSESAPSGSTKMTVGPEVSRPTGRYSQPSSKQESKSKEKCTVM